MGLEFKKNKQVGLSMRIFTFILSLCLTTSPLLARSELEREPPSQGQPVRTFFDSHNYMFRPLFLAAAGALRGGAYGAGIGFVLGATEELLLSQGMIKTSFLSAGMVGVGVLSRYSLDGPLRAGDEWIQQRWPAAPSLHSGRIPLVFASVAYSGAQVLRFAAGLMISRWALQVKDYLPEQGMVGGMVYGGNIGSAVGGAVELSEKYLMRRGLLTRPLGTDLIKGLVLSKLFIPQTIRLVSKLPYAGPVEGLLLVPYFAEGLGVLIVAVILNVPESAATHGANKTSTSSNGTSLELSEGAEQEEWKAVELAKQLGKLGTSLLAEEELSAHAQRQAVVLLVSELVGLDVNLLLMGHYQAVDVMFSNLNNPALTNLATISKPLRDLAFFTIPYYGRKLVLGYIGEYFSDSLVRKISDALNREVLSGEVPLKIGKNEKLLNDMRKDLETISTKGAEVFSSAIDAAVSGTFSMGYLHSQDSLDLMVYLFVYDKILEKFVIYLSDWETSFDPLLRDGNSRLNTLDKVITQNAPLIVKGGYVDFLQGKQQQLTSRHRNIQDHWRVAYWARQALMLPKGMLDYVIAYFVVSLRVLDGKAEFNDRLKLTHMGTKTADLFSWKSSHSGDIRQIELAADSLTSLVKNMRQAKDETCQQVVYTSEPAEHPFITIKNFQIVLPRDEKTDEKKVLLRVDDLTLTTGRYSFSGPSGSGKSSFLSKLQGLQFDPLCASGQINFGTPDGERPRVDVITQADFLPYSTLFELVTYRIPAEQKESFEDRKNLEEKATQFLRELDFDPRQTGLLEALSESSVEEKDWAAILSGGQKKKLNLTALVLVKPKIAVLDEFLTGLDARSRDLAQNLLSRELVNSIVVGVDHHARDNNGTGFYDKHLVLRQGTIEVSP